MRRYKILIIVMFFLCVFCFSRASAVVNDYSLLGKFIYLDAGHGGIDSGAVSGNVLEKDINLILVKKLEHELVARGAMVVLTREDDSDLATTDNQRKRDDLYKRVVLINRSNCDLYLSIHLNATEDSRWRGLQIFYSGVVKSNELLAKAVNDVLYNNLSHVRDIKENNSYYMYKNISVPGILIEAGFLSNPSDKYLLMQEEYQDKLVTYLVDGVVNYFNSI